MKKILAIAILTLNINLFASDSFIQKCPILNIENKTENDFFQANKLLLELKESYEKTATVYIDILKGYNKTDDILKYVSKDGLTQLSSTRIWGVLTALQYFGKEEKGYKLAYENIINAIDSNNPIWCNSQDFDQIISNQF